MATITINTLPTASTIDGTQDILPIYTASSAATQGITRNTLLGLSSAPVGLTDAQTLTNKILTAPTINGATLSGTLSGTYTIGGTPTFPSSVTQNTVVQTLTNKTLTSPTINSPTITNATINTDTITGYTASTTGAIYGINVTSGVFSTSNIIVDSNITTGNLKTNKFSNPYKFSVYRNAALNSAASGSAVITFDTSLFDTGSNYSTGTGRFTAPVNGFYWFSARASVGLGGTTRFFVNLYKNGTEILRGNDNVNVASTPNGSIVTGIVSLSAGDYIQIYNYYGAAATALEIGYPQCYFQGMLISAT